MSFFPYKLKGVRAAVMLLSLLLLAPPAGAFEVEIDGDRLSIQAAEVPLQEVLKRLADTGIAIKAAPDINPRVSADFSGKPLHEGFRSLISPYGFALFWERQQGSRKLRLAEIQVFDPGRQTGPDTSIGTDRFALGRLPENGALYVRHEILIRARPGADGSLIEQLVTGVGGVILEKNDTLGIYRARLPEGIDIPAFLEDLKQKEGRLEAEPNFAYPIDLPFGSPGTAFFVGGDDTLPPAVDGAAPVAVLDSGFLSGFGLEEQVIAALDAVQPDMPVTDGLGHGTQMAMVAAGAVRPLGADGTEDARTPIIPIRTFDDNGITSNFAIMRGIDFAARNGARVLSMSWGSETPSPFLEEALNHADDRGLILVASAGNAPTGKPVYPAAYEAVLGVGALAPDGTPWKQSNFGESVSVAAPGYAAFPVGYKGEAGIYAGTSIAAAYVANMISGWLSENPDWKKADVMKQLRKIESPGAVRTPEDGSTDRE